MNTDNLYTPIRLKEVEVKLSKKVKRFTDIKRLNPIPTDCIIDKTLPGLGATYAEITALRHSILILPNVATILSKHDKHKGDENPTLPVYELTKIKDIKEYLQTSSTYKKILTTPEGFINKVKPILEETMYKDYFLLLDESHKYTTDSGYRKDMLLPLEDFFDFTNKAMISSTVLIPSDFRFVTEGFKLIKLKPHKPIKHSLDIIKTPNTSHSLVAHINESKSEQYFIFFNSVQGIISIIENMKKSMPLEEVEGNCHIFCSNESSKELHIKGYKESYNVFVDGAKYNFFTSSFYNGLDLNYNGRKANVVMISDIKFASHSALHPYVDVLQIRGRFRLYEKDKRLVDWVESFTHIVKTYKALPTLTRGEAIKRIEDTKVLYEYVQEFNTFSPLNKITDVVEAMLDRVHPYTNLLKADKTLDPFKVDNYLYQEEVKSHYKTRQTILEAYHRLETYCLRIGVHRYFAGLENLKYGQGKYSPENYRDVTDILWECEGLTHDYWSNLQITELYQHFELIVKPYYKLGVQYMYQLGFDHKLIQRAMNFVETLEGFNKFGVIDAVHQEFSVDGTYLLSDIKSRLQSIFDLFQISTTAEATDLKMYFEIEECQKNRQRAFRILRRSKNNFYSRV